MRNLYCEVPISFVTAALGGELEVPTLDGRVNLKIPPETQTGKLFRMRGKGVKPVRGGGVGDLLCRVVVETPVKLNSKQKDLLRELRRQHEGQRQPQPPGPLLAGWGEEFLRQHEILTRIRTINREGREGNSFSRYPVQSVIARRINRWEIASSACFSQ